MFAIISRSYYPKQTQGLFVAFDGDRVVLQLAMLELPYLENKQNISAILPGTYWCEYRNHATFGECFQVLDVPGRTGIYFHSGTYAAEKEILDLAVRGVKSRKIDTLGCILPGMRFEDINKDGFLDVYESKKALRVMVATMPKRFQLIIR